MRSPVSAASPRAAGRPRPSRKWHALQDLALNSGPRPSLPAALAGAETQLVLNRAFPTEKARRWVAVRVGLGNENAWASAR
jgi:hypothetical protein